jgi:hypothetical protein
MAFLSLNRKPGPTESIRRHSTPSSQSPPTKTEIGSGSGWIQTDPLPRNTAAFDQPIHTEGAPCGTLYCSRSSTATGVLAIASKVIP